MNSNASLVLNFSYTEFHYVYVFFCLLFKIKFKIVISINIVNFSDRFCHLKMLYIKCKIDIN